MKLRDAILIALGGALLLFIAIFAVRVAERYPTARAELGRVKLMQLTDPTRDTLASLDEPVLITYYVSRRDAMPSSMRRIERDVTDLLTSMERASNGRLEFQVIDPERDPAFASFAAHQRVAPYRVRTVTRDAVDETTVWSTLHMSMGARPAAVINGVSPDHLPRLQALIVGQIRQMLQPRRPVIAIAAPDHYRNLARGLAQRAEVIRVDFAQGDALPREADVLFWMEPGDVTASQVRAVKDFLARGRSVIVAGSRHEILVDGAGAQQSFALASTNYDAQTLLSAFGLQPIDGFVLDELSQAVPGEVAPRPARFFVRCIAANQDFRGMRSMPNGHLLFAAPTPIALNGPAIAERGYHATVLATTSDRTTIADVPEGPLDLASAELFAGEPVPKLPLMVWLRPAEPWRGSIVFAASASAFRDGMYDQNSFAHQRLVTTLVDTLASDERLVIHRTGIERAEPLPELRASTRLLWRIVCSALVPIGLIGLALARGVIRRDQISAPRQIAGALPLLVVAALVVIVAITAVIGRSRIRLDLTAERVNALAPASRDIARQAARDGEITATLYFSREAQLPPELRPHVRRLRGVLREFAQSGAALEVRWQHPEELDPEDREAIEAAGIRPMRVTTTGEESTTVRSVFSTLRLERGDRTTLLHFPSERAFEHLEFRLAFALWRLDSGAQPHIGFASDVPRLSAAEVYHDFQQKQLMAPSGTDVYSDARSLLELHDFRVSHIDPQSPDLPDDLDLLIWMQPRRNVLPMLNAAVEALHDGVPVIIAGQHFNMQARQYRGAGFETVYWPQPQVMDLELHYLPQLGVEMVREVVFDELKAAMPLQTQVNRDADERDYEEQTSALPFLVRASTRSFADHPAMRGLGDQMLPFPTRLALDRARLDELDLDATVLMTTSDRSWSFAWEGGWIPRDVLAGPAAGNGDGDDSAATFTGPYPLAVLLEGAFPLPEDPLLERRLDTGDPLALSDRRGEPTRLLLLGGSHLFRNERLADPEFRADHLLLNLATYMALDEALAAIITQRLVPRGLPYIEPEMRLRWRAIVIAAGPVAMLVLALGWTSWRRMRRVRL